MCKTHRFLTGCENVLLFIITAQEEQLATIKAQEEQLATGTKALTKGTNNLHQLSPRVVSDCPSVIAW